MLCNAQASARKLYSDESDRGPSRTTTWGLEDEDFDANISAAYSAKRVVLSPRSRSLKETFESLAAGREVLSLNTLMKWDYVSRSVERGLISLNQARKLKCTNSVARRPTALAGVEPVPSWFPERYNFYKNFTNRDPRKRGIVHERAPESKAMSSCGN